jgi:hypothetical protein
LSKCKLDISSPKFRVLGGASSTDIEEGLKELQAKVARGHDLSGFFCQPMQGYPQYEKKVWKWDFEPAGQRSYTRKGWRLFAYVPDPSCAEPIPAIAFLCYDKTNDPGGNPAFFIAGALKEFLSETVKIEPKPERFHRQTLAERRYISTCYECFEQFISSSKEEADLRESGHECNPPK